MASTAARAIAGVRTNAVLHEVLPRSVALGWIRRKADLAWRDPKVRFQAEVQMKFAVGRTQRAAEAASLARDYVYESYKYGETLFRAREICRFEVDNFELIADLQRRGRPIILSVLHHGQYMGAMASVARRGLSFVVPANPVVVEGDEPGPRAHRRAADSGGFRMIPAAGSYRILSEVLAAGGAVGILCDIAGTGTVRYLGWSVGCAVGTWKLSFEYSAPVVILSSVRQGDWQRVRIAQVVDPRDFVTGPELLQAVFDAHEPAVLAWPEALRQPVQLFNFSNEDSLELGLEDPLMSPMVV